LQRFALNGVGGRGKRLPPGAGGRGNSQGNRGVDPAGNTDRSDAMTVHAISNAHPVDMIAERSSALATNPLELLTVDDLVDLLKVRKSWVYDEAESGRLRAVRLGRQLRFRVADVEAYLIRAAST
jgi:excisionase family DNA binding protein